MLLFEAVTCVCSLMCVFQHYQNTFCLHGEVGVIVKEKKRKKKKKEVIKGL